MFDLIFLHPLFPETETLFCVTDLAGCYQTDLPVTLFSQIIDCGIHHFIIIQDHTRHRFFKYTAWIVGYRHRWKMIRPAYGAGIFGCYHFIWQNQSVNDHRPDLFEIIRLIVLHIQQCLIISGLCFPDGSVEHLAGIASCQIIIQDK